jgi:BirA family biotin operon repressor/biotin-[acetyl-CoA-carboxylase] ligase
MAENPYRGIETGEPGRIGWRIHYFAEIDSTQNAAREMAAQGAAEGTVVTAETQTAGRGRMGRSWHSPPGGNLYATIILRPTMPLSEVARLSLVAGVAAADAISQVTPGIVALKWPNDIWLRGRKTGGIIAEAVTNDDGSLACVLLGIGLNINLSAHDIPVELRDKATSVRIAIGHPCDRIELARSLFSLLDSRYTETQAHGFESVRPVWESYSALTAKRVSIVENGRRISGIVRGIDAGGALMLATEAGVERIVAGEVSVEGAYS